MFECLYRHEEICMRSEITEGFKAHLHGAMSTNRGSMLCSSSSLGEAKPLLQDKTERSRLNTHTTRCLPCTVKSTGICKSKAAGRCSTSQSTALTAVHHGENTLLSVTTVSDNTSNNPPCPACLLFCAYHRLPPPPTEPCCRHSQ